MDERVFLNMSPTELPVYHQHGTDQSHSLIAQMIKLNGILYDINTFNATATAESLQEDRVRDSVAELSAALGAWQSDLPADMQYTADNLQYWADLGCGPSFVVLHINFNHASQLLFYRFLHNSLPVDQPSPSSPVNTMTYDPTTFDYATKCRTHAANLCEIIYASSSSLHHAAANNTEVQYPLAGHMLVIASTVHLHTLLFGTDDAEISLARARLEQNFQIISRLQRYWPSLQASFSRLRAFHAACMDMDVDKHEGGTDVAFRLDRWMLRFLLDFAKPVDVAERYREGEGGDDPAFWLRLG
jgi:hypothetical protein